MRKKSTPTSTTRKRFRDAIPGIKTPRPDWKLGNAARRLEEYLKIARGSIVFYGSDGKPANPTATLGSLREKAQTTPKRQLHEDFNQAAFRVVQETIKRSES